MKYQIQVYSIGYEDYTKIVDVFSLSKAKQFELQAKVEWCVHNATDIDTIELPFTRITKLSAPSVD